MAWKLIPNPKDGDRVVYVGCHAVDWRPEFGRPTVAFIEDEKTEALRDQKDHLEGQLASATDLGNTYCRENGLPEGDNPKHCINQLAWSLAEFKQRLALLEHIHYSGHRQDKPDQTVTEPTKPGSEPCKETIRWCRTDP